MKPVVIFGTGIISEVVEHYLGNVGGREIAAFCIDARYMKESEHHGKPVCAFEEVQDIYPPDRFEMFVALGYQDVNRARKRKCEEAVAKGYRLASFVHPSASNTAGCEIGQNSLVLENCVIGPFCKIGWNTFLWGNNTIGHHSTIGDHCFLVSHANTCGCVIVAERSFLGANATIGHALTVGAGSFIGANALVTSEVEPNSVHIVAQTPKFRLDAETFWRIAKMF